MSYCQNCGGLLDEAEMNFCPFCGSSLHKTKCFRCGRELEKGERICPSCRTPKGKRAPEKLLSETLSAPANFRRNFPGMKNKIK
jgi:RNA polymerase subunit RPABC4/transcription elongation factor Spt4